MKIASILTIVIPFVAAGFKGICKIMGGTAAGTLGAGCMMITAGSATVPCAAGAGAIGGLAVSGCDGNLVREPRSVTISSTKGGKTSTNQIYNATPTMAAPVPTYHPNAYARPYDKRNVIVEGADHNGKYAFCGDFGEEYGFECIKPRHVKKLGDFIVNHPCKKSENANVQKCLGSKFYASCDGTEWKPHMCKIGFECEQKGRKNVTCVPI
jgi:hypothetical protein